MERASGGAYSALSDFLLKDIFTSIKEDLTEGNSVLFTGTGCQVAGLINILDRKNKQEKIYLQTTLYVMVHLALYYGTTVKILFKKIQVSIVCI